MVNNPRTAMAVLGLTGNFFIAVDPLVDTAGGDYHLAAGSEAIDAGTVEGAPGNGGWQPQAQYPPIQLRSGQAFRGHKLGDGLLRLFNGSTGFS